ncbi:MAG: translation initiation factor IF-2 [Clostridiales Family XIII bacterium]|jgi:translation initiation factor IF-2|nr:translation initiation factor IF-2 [Clostridiales Family XIII bacterium]
MLVKDLAAELGKSNNEVLEKALELGINARGATKNLSDNEVLKIRRWYEEGGEKDRKGPRRIKRADVEAEKKAAEEAAAAAEAEAERLRAEAAAQEESKKAPVLSVAKKYIDEPEPKPAKKEAGEPAAEKAPVEKAEKAAKAEKAEKADAAEKAVTAEAPAATGAETAPDTDEDADAKAKAEEAQAPAAQAEAPEAAPSAAGAGQTPAEGQAHAGEAPAAKGAADAKDGKGAKDAGAPASKEAQGAKKEGGQEKQKKSRDGRGGGAQQGQGGGAKDQKKEGGAQKGAAESGGTPSKGKKKKGKDAKAGDASRGGDKKKGARDGRRGGLVEDFKGASRNPIIEEGTLEKQQRKRVRRHTKDRADGVEEMLIDVAPGTHVVTVPITVAGLASQVERSTSELILALVKMGIMANINQYLDEVTVELLADELDIDLVVGRDETDEDEAEDYAEPDDVAENEGDVVPRPPIITVMGHVDHGKTSLLDAIRSTHVTEKEAGGITQHIGASEVTAPSGERIVFLDTPGHEAFTAMRARGAHVTDIAVLVVAADDGVMPQTIESISHAKAAGVPIIVAINKIDKEGANPDRVKQELSENGVLVEEWGGDVIAVPVSAKARTGIDNLLEMILLQAEVLELTANPKKKAVGTVIEARLDKSKGALATLLVLDGTLTDKMSIVAGTTSAKVRTMTDFKGKTIRKAGPATAVEITGFSEVPQAGDEFHALKDDRRAREIAEKRRLRQREEVMAKTSGTSLENLFSKIREGEVKELKIIVKADVMGSVGAIAASLEKIDVEGVKVSIIHRGAGTVTESDVMLASTSGAIIIGFNVRPPANVTSLAEREGVEIRLYRVIYDVIGDVEAALKGMLDPEYREVVLGKAEVRETFRLPNGSTIAGTYVVDGKILRNAEIRLVRDGVVIHEGRVSSLRRFKDDVREVAQGYECGIGIENYNDIKVGDEIEAFRMEEIERE